VQWGLLAANPVATAEPPRVSRTEIEILAPGQIKTVLDALKGRPLYVVAIVGLATGMRRGEIVGLRWGDIDLDGGRIRIERSLEQTNAGLSFKSPKTKAGRRTVSIPPSVTAELRRHWREQQEARLQLGLGRAGDEDLVFPRPDGSGWPPDSLTSEWARAIRILELPKVTLHALRHTHVSQLIAAGLDVVSVSRRIGHSNPTVTLGVYAHLFGNTDERAAAVVEAALSSALREANQP
jgi:integrase